MCLAQQIYPHKMNYLIDAYTQATAHSYGWLMLNFMATTPETFRVRQGLLKVLFDKCSLIFKK